MAGVPRLLYWLYPLGLHCWLTLSTTRVPTDLSFLSLSAHPLSFAIRPEPQPPLTLAQPCPLPASIFLYYTEVCSLPWWLAACVLSHFSRIQFFVTLWTVAHEASVSMGFSRQEHEWVAVPSFRGSSLPRDRTCISCSFCIAGGFFIIEPPRTTNHFL